MSKLGTWSMSVEWNTTLDCGVPRAVNTSAGIGSTRELGISKGHVSLECESLSQGYENNSREVAPIGQTLPATEAFFFLLELYRLLGLTSYMRSLQTATHSYWKQEPGLGRHPHVSSIQEHHPAISSVVVPRSSLEGGQECTSLYEWRKATRLEHLFIYLGSWY